jgi:hypothetical protein
MFPRLLESAEVSYSSFERIEVIYKTFRVSKEEILYVMKRITDNSFSA